MAYVIPDRPKAKSLKPLRALLPFLLPHWRVLALAMGALLVAAGAQLALPVALRFLIDEGLAVRDAATINRYITLFLAAAVVFNEAMEVSVALSEMERAAKGAVTLEVTAASRDVELDGVAVREGQAIGLADGVLVVARDDPDECLLALLDGRADSHDIGLTIHPHPTLSESLGLAAELAAGTVTDLMPPRPRKQGSA